MINGICLCIVGAGSSYSPELVEGLLGFTDEQLPVREVRMYDVDEDRLGVMAALARRMIAHAGRAITVRHGSALAPLLDGVDFVITQIRVGGMPARILDEKIPLRHGVIGQETTGPGGMFKALRTIPPMLEIARQVEQIAPLAFILNYTNPSGIITEAVCRHTHARMIGLCSGIPGMQVFLRDLLSEQFGEIHSYCVGLNHLGFIHKFMTAGRDVSDEVIDFLVQSLPAEKNAGCAPIEIIRALRAVPIAYVNYYLKRLQTVEEALSRTKTRGEEIIDIEQQVFAEARDECTVTKPEALARRGGGGYANVTFRFMQAIAFDLGDELVCSVPNQDTVEGIEMRAAVEVVCKVDRSGPHPLPVGPIPLAYRGLVQAVKAYETLTVEAAVTRSRDLAIQALINNPLVVDLSLAETLVDELLLAHGLHYT